LPGALVGGGLGGCATPVVGMQQPDPDTFSRFGIGYARLRARSQVGILLVDMISGGCNPSDANRHLGVAQP
jgi:hypothetical protein